MKKKPQKQKRFVFERHHEMLLWSQVYAAWRAAVPAPFADRKGLNEAAALVADIAVLHFRKRLP
jgi:hypothetical protein